MTDSPPDTGLLDEILAGLSGGKKSLPSKLLYDAAGSELFQRIIELPQYYLTRTEKRLLDVAGGHFFSYVAIDMIPPVSAKRSISTCCRTSTV